VSELVYFAGGGGFEIPDSNRTFHFPPSRTYVAGQKPMELTAAPLWFLPVIRNVPIPSAVSGPKGQT
jgi:hypothetical protein